MSLKVFIEYKLIPEKKRSFLSLIPELKHKALEQNVLNYQIYEGDDQEDIIVEEFYVENKETYLSIKEERLSTKHDFWSLHHEYVLGGREKVHIWLFKKI